METFKVGDRIYAEEDFIYGRIVGINGDVAHVEFRTSGGGGCLPYKLSELKHERWCSRRAAIKHLKSINIPQKCKVVIW